jgi:hypothetical protein
MRDDALSLEHVMAGDLHGQVAGHQPEGLAQESGDLRADLRFVPRRLSGTIWAWVSKIGDLMP